ncbi:rhomboid family intramembrane serine protease [candidate division KSB1 bacterium]
MYYRNYEMNFGLRITPGVKNLLIANCIVYFLQALGFIPVQIFGIVPYKVTHEFFIWQLFTYMFLHGSTFHILINMFVLWMFGTEIEKHWGTREFYKYYFFTGVGAGLFNVLFQPNGMFVIVGASGAIYGLLLAFGLMFPNRLILLYFFFPIKAKYLVLIFGAISFFSAFGATDDGIAHFAHLGGLVAGFFYLKLDWKTKKFWSYFKIFEEKPKMKLHRKDKTEYDDYREQIDEILDKINEVGYENLTEEEREILKKASKRY